MRREGEKPVLGSQFLDDAAFMEKLLPQRARRSTAEYPEKSDDHEGH